MASQQNQGRARSKSMLSFGSVRSHRSTGSGGKIDLTETAKEKAGRKMTSKADPTKAISEAQPGKEDQISQSDPLLLPIDTNVLVIATQAQEGSTLESIRNMQHRDANGNIISKLNESFLLPTAL